MARTTILPADANKRKAWAAAVAEDAAKDQYFARLEGPEGSLGRRLAVAPVRPDLPSSLHRHPEGDDVLHDVLNVGEGILLFAGIRKIQLVMDSGCRKSCVAEHPFVPQPYAHQLASLLRQQP